MNRRGLGVGLLLAAAAVIVVTPVALTPVQIAGIGRAAPLPEPPQVGDCLNLDATRVAVTSCDEPHYAEVTAAYSADDPSRAESTTDEQCADQERLYVNEPALAFRGWTVASGVHSRKIDAPDTDRIGLRGWTVCSVTAGSGIPYSGSLHSLTITERPMAATTCLVLASSDKFSVPCDRPHTDETLATTFRQSAAPDLPPAPQYSDSDPVVEVPVEVTAQLHAECADVAAAVLESTDPTRVGLLRLTVQANAFRLIDSGDIGVSATCSIGPADGRRLTNTVMGLGDKPVPYS